MDTHVKKGGGLISIGEKEKPVPSETLLGLMLVRVLSSSTTDACFTLIQLKPVQH